jgi:hypothetical protein
MLLGQTDSPGSCRCPCIVQVLKLTCSADAQNLVTIFNTTFINQTTQIASLQDNADSAVLTVAPNKYAAWTGAGYYGGTPVPIPDVGIKFRLNSFSYSRSPGFRMHRLQGVQYQLREPRQQWWCWTSTGVRYWLRQRVLLRVDVPRDAGHHVHREKWKRRLPQESGFRIRVRASFFLNRQPTKPLRICRDYIYGFGTAYFDQSLMGTRGAGWWATLGIRV